jgi:hypothetical protein
MIRLAYFPLGTAIYTIHGSYIVIPVVDGCSDKGNACKSLVIDHQARTRTISARCQRRKTYSSHYFGGKGFIKLVGYLSWSLANFDICVLASLIRIRTSQLIGIGLGRKVALDRKYHNAILSLVGKTAVLYQLWRLPWFNIKVFRSLNLMGIFWYRTLWIQGVIASHVAFVSRFARANLETFSYN